MRLPYIIFAISLISSPLAAGPQEDAEYIASQTVTEEVFAGALIAMAPLISNSTAHELRKQGIVISDIDTFTTILGEEFLEEFTLGMQKEAVPFYIDNFSVEHLADLATFYRSEAGQHLIKITPDLTQFGATAGEKVGRVASANAMSRVAKRLKDEGITVTNNKNMMTRLLKALQ